MHSRAAWFLAASCFAQDAGRMDQIIQSCRTHYLRDWNAAKNVRAEGLRIVAEGHPETGNACGLRVSLAEASVAG